MSSAFTQAAIATIIAWGVSYGILRPLFHPRGDITTRSGRGRQFAANALALTFAVTCTSAITGNGEKDRVIAAAVLPPILALVFFGIGWLVGPSRSNSKTPTHELGGDCTLPKHKSDPSEAASQRNVDSLKATDQIYEQIADEIERGNIQRGAWTRIYAECEGDESRTKVEYIRYRATTLLHTNKVDSVESKAADTPAANSLEIERTSKLEAHADLNEDQLTDLLCNQILEESSTMGIISTIKTLENHGLDIETIEMLVVDRLGPEGAEKLKLYLS